jgi:hypothetical protein
MSDIPWNDEGRFYLHENAMEQMYKVVSGKYTGDHAANDTSLKHKPKHGRKTDCYDWKSPDSKHYPMEDIPRRIMDTILGESGIKFKQLFEKVTSWSDFRFKDKEHHFKGFMRELIYQKLVRYSI